MLSSRSINIPYFYSTVPQGYFLLLWFGNVLLSCALMLIWKFDAPIAASPPSLRGGNTSISPPPSHLVWHHGCFSALSSPSHLLLPSFLSLLSFNSPHFLLSLNVPQRPTVTFRFIKTRPASLSCILFMKYSPLVDLIGVAMRSGAWNAVCGAFKELPGESCT